MDTASRLELHRRMTRIRAFEERVSRLYRDGEIPGFVHVSTGQEAAAVGACWPLGASDVITSTHRGHGHCLARGLEASGMFAELLGRETGTNRGRGGSMHIADPSAGMFGANGIVAAGLPIAAGAATAARLRDSEAVVVAFFGDGAVAQGAFHEAANVAALWRLRLVLFCENNHYAEFAAAETQHPVPLARRADGYGIPYVAVDGNDVSAVAATMTEIVEKARGGGGPYLVEADTYRWHGHYEGDPERYRPQKEVETWRTERDPLAISRRALAEVGVGPADVDALEREVEEEVSAGLEVARRAPEPQATTVTDFVTAPRDGAVPGGGADPEADAAPGRESFRTMDAIRLALEHELESDPGVFLAGVDVGAGGNVFGLTRGLHERWPERVRDTPISETAIVGLGVGAALAGLRPVVEIMYLDFIGVCFDQIMNQAAKMRYMSGGKVTVPLTLRTQFGAGRSSGAQHSQSLEALLAHVPGLTVVMPSDPAETYGLLRAAIQDPNPVVFIENRLLYGRKGPRPDASFRVPIGRAKTVRAGSDVTIVAVSRMVFEALEAADALAHDGIDAEVIDLRTVVPLDRDAILSSLARTSRLVVAHEAVRDFGIGAEIAALAAYEGFWSLDAPVRRIGALASPAPYSPALERAWLPGKDAIEEAVRATLAE